MFLFLESHFKDNPTISMLNDSDEEIFGYFFSVNLYKLKVLLFLTCGKIGKN